MMITRVWRARNGKTIKVEGFYSERHTSTEKVYADGWGSNVKKNHQAIAWWSLTDGDGFVHGSTIEEMSQDQKKKYPGYTHRIGMVALTEDDLKLVMEIKNEVENSLAFQQVKEDYEIEQKPAKKMKGLCSKCHTFCYGDCHVR
jgi:hypothetical protein